LPNFSPDGSQIAFAWDGGSGSASKSFDVFVKVVGGENLLRLTHHPSECPITAAGMEYNATLGSYPSDPS
jgi:hypothetical protein